MRISKFTLVFVFFHRLSSEMLRLGVTRQRHGGDLDESFKALRSTPAMSRSLFDEVTAHTAATTNDAKKKPHRHESVAADEQRVQKLFSA